MKFNEKEWTILINGVQLLLSKKKSDLIEYRTQLRKAEENGPVEAVQYYQDEIQRTEIQIEEIQTVLERINI